MTDARAVSSESAALRDERRRTLLVVAPSWVGDLVMAIPALRALRGAFPERRIVALARPGLEELLAASGCVDQTHLDDLRGLAGPWRAGRAVARMAPSLETCVLLPNSFRSALAARFSGARDRIGYRTDGRAWLLTRAVGPPGGRGGRKAPFSTVDWYSELIERAFECRVADRTPRLTPTPEQERAAARLLEGVTGEFVVLNPGANRADKRWPADRFAALGARLRQEGRSVLVTGGPREAELSREVAAGAGGIDLVARGVTLGALLAVLRGAKLLITNDTGPRHLAVAVGCPVVALFGPTDWRWTALADIRERRLVAEPFLPEEMMADRHPKACRIERVELADVHAACVALLQPASR